MGHKLLCCGLFMNMLDVKILLENNAEKIAFIPIIKLKTNAR
jgi:hypothetical protein